MVSTKHKAASASRNKQLSTSHHFPAIISPRHFMRATILIFTLSHCIFLQNRVIRFFSSATWQPGRRCCTFGCTHAAHRTGTKLRTEQQREDEKKWEWVIPKKEADDKRQDEQKSDLASPKEREGKQHVLQRQSLGRSSGFLAAAALRYQAQRGSADSGLSRAQRFPLGLAHDLHDNDRGHLDVSPRSVAAVVYHPT